MSLASDRRPPLLSGGTSSSGAGSSPWETSGNAVVLVAPTTPVVIGTDTAAAGRLLTVAATDTRTGVRVEVGDSAAVALDVAVRSEAFARVIWTPSGLSLGAGRAAPDWALQRTSAAEARATGTLQTAGRKIAAIFRSAADGPYTVEDSDEFVGVDTTSGSQDVYLPPGANGRAVTVKNTAALGIANVLRIWPAGAQTIDSVSDTYLLTGARSLSLVGRTEVGWFIL